MGDGQQYKRPQPTPGSLFTVAQPANAFFDQAAAGPVVEEENSFAQAGFSPVEEAPADAPMSSFLRPWPNLLAGYL